MKYLIGLDIDGTILTDNGVLKPETIDYIKKIQKEGHIVSLITGRPDRTTRPIYNKLGLKSPIGNYSGSYIHHPYDYGFPIKSYKMPADYIYFIMKTFKEDIINAFCELEDHVYLYKNDEHLENWLASKEGSLTVGEFTFDDDISGAVLFAHPTIKPKLEKYLSKFKDLGYRYWRSLKVDDYAVVEIYTKLSSKANAMEIIRSYYNIPHEHTIAMGDGSNDIEMLSYAYNSAATIAAPPRVKESAKEVGGSNNDFAVVDYLEKITGIKR